MRGAGLWMRCDEMIVRQRDAGAFEESEMQHPLIPTGTADSCTPTKGDDRTGQQQRTTMTPTRTHGAHA
jgi:hypothetical protein